MSIRGKLASCLLAAALAVGLVPVHAFAEASGTLAIGFFLPLALPKADYSWYVPDASEYAIKSAYQFVGFANLVNGSAPEDVAQAPVDFEGKVVKSTVIGTLDLWGHDDWTPIGSAAHPFAGEFDGNGMTVKSFTVNGKSRSSYLGLFGYVTGDVRNVKTGNDAAVSVSRAKSSGDVVHHVAGVAGYCAGSMAGCVNAAKVTVTTAVMQSSKAPQVAYAIGGVAGECSGDMTDCENKASGTVSVKASAAATSDDSGLVRYVGGVVGVSGDLSRIGTRAKPIAASTDARSSLAGCLNGAQVTADTPSTAGKDRFGETVYSRSVCVGGVVGYAQGDVSDCSNGSFDSGFASASGYVRAEHGSQVGGIAGSLRATPSASGGNEGVPSADDGSAGDDPDSTAVRLSSCRNYGDVYALNSVGGIAGTAGSYTTVTGCINSKKKSDQPTFVVATRWNKPSPAGLVGSTSGDVSYCANFAIVASGTWKSEADRTLKEGSGYYASGLVGMTTHFSKATDSGTRERTSPVPEVYGCYNAGYVMALSDMRQCGLVGENAGYVHDNLLREGMVEKERLIYDEGSSGNAARNEVLDDEKLRERDAVKALNGACDSEGWDVGYWVPSADSSGKDAALNYGFPMLASSNPVDEADRTDLSAAEVSFAGASYTGGTGGSAAVPIATVSVGGEELVQGADFRVRPQDDAIDIGVDYTASIEGIGRYRGNTSGSYSIVRGSLKDCTVTVESATFDFNGHYPFAVGADGPGKVTVTTSGGVVVDPSEYAISKVERRSSGTVKETFVAGKSSPVNASDYYYVIVTVEDGSEHFSSGSNEGVFRINPADLQTDVDYGNVKVTWANKSYKWVSSGDEADSAKPKTALAYTGSPIKPTVSGLEYNGNKLTAGKDYRVVYGNPNPVATGGSSYDANNTGTVNGKGIGCVTVRFMTGGNFTNYQNMFFSIPNGLASAKVSGIANKVYTGKALTQNPVVKVGSTTLKKGTHYTVSYKNNKAIGTATVTVTGKGKYAGARTATFKIGKKNPLTVKAKSPAVAYSKTAARNIAAKNAVAVSKAQGKVTYKKTAGNANITVSSAGKLTVKKGTKRNTYTVKVAVTAAGNKTYLPATKTVSVKVKVK